MHMVTIITTDFIRICAVVINFFRLNTREVYEYVEPHTITTMVAPFTLNVMQLVSFVVLVVVNIASVIEIEAKLMQPGVKLLPRYTHPIMAFPTTDLGNGVQTAICLLAIGGWVDYALDYTTR